MVLSSDALAVLYENGNKGSWWVGNILIFKVNYALTFFW